MLNINSINWQEYVFNAQNSTSWKPTLTPHFLDHLLPILASVPLQRDEYNKISATKTFKEMPETIETSDFIVSGEDMKRIIGFLYLMPRSRLLTKSQGKEPLLGSLTPIVMYAQKLHHKVGYEEWNKKDKKLKFFLGRFLEPLLEKNLIIPTVFDTDDVIKARLKALRHVTGAKAGTMAKVTDYKCNVTSLDIERYEDDELYDSEPIQKCMLPKVILIMKLQIWIANAALRKPNVMILDPKNWDATPKAIDVEVVEEVTPWSTNYTPPEKPAEDLPW